MTAKTRIVLVTSQTIPRLELMTARLLANLVDTVKRALEKEVRIDEVTLLSGSQTVLRWIENRNEWKVFMKHSVNEILKKTKKEE